MLFERRIYLVGSTKGIIVMRVNPNTVHISRSSFIAGSEARQHPGMVGSACRYITISK